MIIKSYEVKKINLDRTKFILFYGRNEGLKKEAINLLVNDKKIRNYEEKEIIDNEHNFIENLLTKSLFEEYKIIIIKRSTNKITNFVENLKSKNLDDLLIIINADNLEKKSKLRSMFEKNKDFVSVAFYPDNNQTLSNISYNFLRKKNISISPSNINLIVNRCNGDRETLMNELKKLEYFNKNGKKITQENIAQLTNLIENHSVSELVDNCLIKNKKKIINILNENNFSNDECVLIIRTFLNKAKKILNLSNEFHKNKNIELTISLAKPPIFWKDKELTKNQILKWEPENIKQLIYKLCEIELLIKRNINNSVNLITDFVLNPIFSKY